MLYIKSQIFRACCEFVPALRLAKITAISVCRQIAVHGCYFAASRLEEIVARKSACAACSCMCCVYIKSHRSAINANFRACCEFLPMLQLAKITAISICRKIAAHRCYFARAAISQNRTVNAFSTRRTSNIIQCIHSSGLHGSLYL